MVSLGQNELTHSGHLAILKKSESTAYLLILIDNTNSRMLTVPCINTRIQISLRKLMVDISIDHLWKYVFVSMKNANILI